jgi:hypothetical protein
MQHATCTCIRYLSVVGRIPTRVQEGPAKAPTHARGENTKWRSSVGAFQLSPIIESAMQLGLTTSALLVASVAGFSPACGPSRPASAVHAAVAAVAAGHPVMMASASSEAAVADRRGVLFAGAAALLTLSPGAAFASGGATAGKYTTIPIAKRRYFGRVKQGVFEFLSLGDAVKKGELSGGAVENFFAANIQTVSARQKRQCVGSDASCKVDEKFSSRWEDMKLSMFLLGNAFRMDSGKPPEKVKQVKEAKAFTQQVEKLRKAAAAGSRKDAALSYAAAIEALDIYLNDVELPPTFAPDYADSADMSVPSLCQGSFCI